MIIRPISTRPINTRDKLEKILDEYVLSMPENAILVITSKVVSICEGSVVKADKQNLSALVQKEADLVLEAVNPYKIALTIKDSVLIPNAGIDHSNGNGNYILWPKNAWKTAETLRLYLKKRFSLKHCGVIITDSKTTPLRWGTTGVALAVSGFAPLNDYRGKMDIFGHELQVTQANVADGLAASAVVAMGEGAEQTPIVMIEDVPFVQFLDRAITKKQRDSLKISMKDDLYGPMLNSAKWRKK